MWRVSGASGGEWREGLDWAGPGHPQLQTRNLRMKSLQDLHPYRNSNVQCRCTAILGFGRPGIRIRYSSIISSRCAVCHAARSGAAPSPASGDRRGVGEPPTRRRLVSPRASRRVSSSPAAPAGGGPPDTPAGGAGGNRAREGSPGCWAGHRRARGTGRPGRVVAPSPRRRSFSSPSACPQPEFFWDRGCASSSTRNDFGSAPARPCTSVVGTCSSATPCGPRRDLGVREW